MTILDTILLICFIPAIVTGINKGFFLQLASLAGLFVGLWLAYRYYLPVSDFLGSRFGGDQPILLHVCGFLIVFLGTILAATIIGKLATGLFKLVSLGWLNRLSGVVFAILKTALVLAIAIYLFDSVNMRLELVKESMLKDSQVWCFFRELASHIFPFLKEVVTAPFKA